MSYQVLARKWRPRQFDEVVGQEHVTHTLKNAIASGRLAHAYLFVGPRGIGKTTIARVFAKALNCASGPTATPCGECDSCREIALGSNLDVLEIDGASNNGVEQVRELRETVRYAPTRGQFRIYIIDEVHMLSTAAFNALLKTLEEPPAHVKFLFATTEPDRVLATIISRCQRFDLRRIPVPLIVERLAQIAVAEGVDVTADALLAVARGAAGGLRDAESALDQLIAFRGESIAEEDVLAVFGLVARGTLEKLAEGILRGGIADIVGLVGKLDAAGKDLQRLLMELIEHFRNLLVFLHVGDAEEALDLTDAQRETLRAQSGLADAERLLRVTDILADTENRMRSALCRRSVLELGLIRAARAVGVVSLEEVLRRLNELKAGLAGDGTARNEPETPAAVAVEAPAPAARVEAEISGDERERLREHWPEIAAQAGRMCLGAQKAVLSGRPMAVRSGTVEIAYDCASAGEMEQLAGGRGRKALEHALTGFLQRSVEVSFRMAEGAERSAEGEEKTRAVRDESGGASGHPRDWRKVPEVRKSLKAFKGKIVDVRE